MPSTPISSLVAHAVSSPLSGDGNDVAVSSRLGPFPINRAILFVTVEASAVYVGPVEGNAILFVHYTVNDWASTVVLYYANPIDTPLVYGPIHLAASLGSIDTKDFAMRVGVVVEYSLPGLGGLTGHVETTDAYIKYNSVNEIMMA